MLEINLALLQSTCYTIRFHILRIIVFMQKQLSHVHVHPLAVVAHACVMSGRAVNYEICCVRVGNNEYLQSVKEESIQFLIYDVVPLQDLDLVVNMHEQRGYTQESASWEGASIQQNSAELHINTNSEIDRSALC